MSHRARRLIYSQRVLGVAFVLAGFVMAVVGLAVLANYRGLGQRLGTLGGSLTFWFDGGQTLRKARRASNVWGAILATVGVAWMVGGITLLA
jgi:hypothetical protein